MAVDMVLYRSLWYSLEMRHCSLKIFAELCSLRVNRLLNLKSNFFCLVVMTGALSTFHFQDLLDVGLKVVVIGFLVDLFGFLFCLLYFLFLILFLFLCLLSRVFDGPGR